MVRFQRAEGEVLGCLAEELLSLTLYRSRCAFGHIGCCVLLDLVVELESALGLDETGGLLGLRLSLLRVQSFGLGKGDHWIEVVERLLLLSRVVAHEVRHALVQALSWLGSG